MDISQISLFKYLTPKELVKLSQYLQKVSFPRGSVLFNENDEGNEMYIILKGKVEVTILDKNDKLVLTTLGEGSFFGEMSLLSNIKRSATIKILDDAEFYMITREGLKKIMKETPAIAVKILFIIASELSNRISKTDKLLGEYFERNKEIINNQLFKDLYVYTLSNTGEEVDFL